MPRSSAPAVVQPPGEGGITRGPLHQRILGAVRGCILDGTWAPGDRLPTVRELCATHDASLLTVHRALRALANLGFITTHGRHGTVVAKHPPHRCCFGLVLPELPAADGHYTHLRWAALAQAALTFTAPQRRVEVFHGVGPHPELAAHRALRSAIADRRLAGLIVPQPDLISAWFAPASCGLPVISGDTDTGGAKIGEVSLRQLDFLDAALDLAKRRGLRQISAMLHSGADRYGGVAHLSAAAAARGQALPVHRLLGVDPRHPLWAAHAVQALLHGSPRPQVLIIGDDHLVTAATTALRSLRGPLPLIIAQVNLPVEAPSPLPCVRIGWDHRDYLGTALDHLHRHLTTGEPVGVHQLPLRITGDTP